MDISKNENMIYKGTLKVKTVKGKTVIDEREYHNTGTIQLFQFICAALKGESWDSLKLLLPRYIMLFTAGQSGTPVPQTNIFSSDNLRSTQSEYMSDTPEIVLDSQNNRSSIKLKFIVPYTHITDITNVNAVGLYNISAINNGRYSDNSAYFYITDSEGNLSEIAQQDMSKYSLYIEWILTFSN